MPTECFPLRGQYPSTLEIVHHFCFSHTGHRKSAASHSIQRAADYQRLFLLCFRHKASPLSSGSDPFAHTRNPCVQLNNVK